MEKIEPTLIRQKMCEEYIRYIYPYAIGRDDKKEAAAKAIQTMQEIINGNTVDYLSWKDAMLISTDALKYDMARR